MNLSEQILTHGKNTPAETWPPQWNRLVKQISQSKHPLGHGTRTDKPEFTGNAFCFALDQQDGLTGTQIFALMLDYPNGFTSSLAIRADIENNETLAERYGRLNPHFASPEAQKHLDMACRGYCQAHGQPQGAPIMLMYDGGTEIDKRFNRPKTPSEVHLYSVMSQNLLKAVLTPAYKVASITAAIPAQIPVYPLELLELAELAELTGTHVSP